MAQIDLRRATVTIRDGGSNFIQITLGEGNLNYSERRNIDVVKSRGELDTIREGDEEPIDVNFQFVWEFITGSSADTVPTLEDVLKRIGDASAWASTAPDTNAPYAVNIEIEYTPVCHAVDEEIILLRWFNFTELAHSIKDGTVDCKGTCNITKAEITRQAQS